MPNDDRQNHDEQADREPAMRTVPDIQDVAPVDMTKVGTVSGATDLIGLRHKAIDAIGQIATLDSSTFALWRATVEMLAAEYEFLTGQQFDISEIPQQYEPDFVAKARADIAPLNYSDSDGNRFVMTVRGWIRVASNTSH